MKKYGREMAEIRQFDGKWGMNMANLLAAPQSRHYLDIVRPDFGPCVGERNSGSPAHKLAVQGIFFMRKIALFAAASAAALSLAACSEATEDAAADTADSAAADAEANMEAAGESMEAAGEDVAAEADAAAAEVEAEVEGETEAEAAAD
ncbi:hypothetical protein [Qipengyuania seohaensis]|uniref:hypothetical protein n=1 Tax=Qipengyuania seohaensis TaxID=266951 RepID=UPI0018E2537F|nr:hypothetical protein [Qipengyuania seohaensis]